MTPEQKLKHAILLLAAKWKDITLSADAEITAENVDALYEEHDEGGMLQDARSELRSTGEETGISAPWSRNYETEAVGKQMPDGSWVGWTHYYGGGKYSEPDAIPWMEDAYDLICTEEQVTVTKRTFTKAPA
jgi:hypothetical protein